MNTKPLVVAISWPHIIAVEPAGRLNQWMGEVEKALGGTGKVTFIATALSDQTYPATQTAKQLPKISAIFQIDNMIISPLPILTFLQQISQAQKFKIKHAQAPFVAIDQSPKHGIGYIKELSLFLGRKGKERAALLEKILAYPLSTPGDATEAPTEKQLALAQELGRRPHLR